MKQNKLLRLQSLLVVMLTMFSMSAMAGNTYYSKVVVNAVGEGKVYASKTSTDSPTYAEGSSEAESEDSSEAEAEGSSEAETEGPSEAQTEGSSAAQTEGASASVTEASPAVTTEASAEETTETVTEAPAQTTTEEATTHSPEAAGPNWHTIERVETVQSVRRPGHGYKFILYSDGIVEVQVF